MNIVKQQEIKITEEGFKALELELSELRDTKRPKLVDRLANARAEGDLKENSDYHNAKDELEFLDGRIAELDNVLKNAVVVKPSNSNGDVSIGAQVTLKSNGKEHTFHIVGEWEADPVKKKISHTSPLGSALVGKRAGDKVEVEAPAGKIMYEILSID
jgi:transcription elongation factor GreA